MLFLAFISEKEINLQGNVPKPLKNPDSLTSTQFNSDGFGNKWMANTFKTSGWPMLLILAEANALNTS